MTDFKIGTPVSWKSSCTQKSGVIIAIVPAGKTPSEISPEYRRLGNAIPRDHTSYIVSGGAKNRRKTLYWPRTSLLKPQKSLTESERKWCEANPELIRRLMNNNINFVTTPRA
ncbi:MULTISPECIES: hypothetical protein [Acetobacter]|uniref:Uncharacterized protein n=1 Tax=Acetobacter pasteurianus NBRC 3188 TaxID=1226663 RepID=A0A401WYC4_ACEPA|nr:MULTISPECIES: hypothetical protein [Acetobacter]GCD54190.1 hypothetical protein NBRC3188_2887 [Acetobacter pasteurianus NBRC 3188]